MLPPGEPLFVLDNSLNPAIAEALAKVGFNIRSVKDVFGEPTGGVKDPTIIDWCAENTAVWLTTDVAVKRQQAQRAKLRRVSAVWYHQPKQGWSTKQQHCTITKFLERISKELASGDIIHFRVGAGEKARLRVEWRTRRGQLL